MTHNKFVSKANSQLEKAARALLKDYKEDKELTAFAVLDFVDYFKYSKIERINPKI